MNHFKNSFESNHTTQKFKYLKDQELNQKVKTLAAEERKLTKEILLHIAEVDKRKICLKMAYPSLFDYLVKEIGYSAGAAHRRIDAARLMQKVPEVSTAIENGQINLSQISKMQKVCRHIKKTSGKAVAVAAQKTVLQKIENKTGEQTDLILAQEFQVDVKVTEKKSIQKDESVRLELTLTKEEFELVKIAQELLSNKTGGGIKDTVVEMAKRIIKSYEPKATSYEPKIKDDQPKTARSVKEPISTSTVEVKNNVNAKNISFEPIGTEKVGEIKSSNKIEDTDFKNLKNNNNLKELKSVTPKLKKQILQRDQFCQFKDIHSGRVCGSKLFLEIDHIQPRWQQGANTSQNLRAMCKNHNLFRYKNQI